MFSTGPMFLTHEASYYPNRSSLGILSPELYGKYTSNSSQSLFQHLKSLFILFQSKEIELFFIIIQLHHGMATTHP